MFKPLALLGGVAFLGSVVNAAVYNVTLGSSTGNLAFSPNNIVRQPVIYPSVVLTVSFAEQRGSWRCRQLLIPGQKSLRCPVLLC